MAINTKTDITPIVKEVEALREQLTSEFAQTRP